MKSKDGKSLHKHIEDVQSDMCSLIDLYIKALADKEKIENAPINQIASALGVIVEKFTKNIRAGSDTGKIQELIAALKTDDSSSS